MGSGFEWEPHGFRIAAGALVAGASGGLFALTQVWADGGLAVAIATYAFAAGLPLGGFAAMFANSDDASRASKNLSAYTRRYVVAVLFLGTVAVVTGISALFAHFHVAAAATFLLTSLVLIAVEYKRPYESGA